LSLAESKQIAIGDARYLTVYRLAVGLLQDEYAVRLAQGVIHRREHSRIETLIAPGDCTSPLIDGAAQASQVIWPEYPVDLDNGAASPARERDEGGEVVVSGNDRLVAPTCRAR
jgi:hypothetical protein